MPETFHVLRGDSVLMLSVTRNVVDTRSYEAFGTKNSEAGSDSLPYAYAGEAFDSTTNLAYHRARWMDSRTGRFTGMDRARGDMRAPQSLHRYMYANSNPANAIDPTGFDAQQMSFFNFVGISLPTGSTSDGYPYEYHFTWPLQRANAVATAQLAMHMLEDDPNRYFPFSVVPLDGAPPSIVAGDSYDLQGPLLPGFGIPYDHNPVNVSEEDLVSFTFTTLPGHFDLPGSTIEFSTDVEGGFVCLHQDAKARTQFETVANHAAVGAHYAWSLMAGALQRDLSRPLLSGLLPPGE